MTKKQSLLITGCNGFLGSNIVDKLIKDFTITGIGRDDSKKPKKIDFYSIDITNNNQIQDFLTKHQFDVIIHCAALINVDLCEENYQLAYDVNAIGTKNLVSNFEGLFLYISTDMLFDGITGNYSEESIPNPLNNYGKTKLAGENFVRGYSSNHLILRTNFFGWNHYSEKQTFVEWIYNSLLENVKINLFNDYYFCPIFIYDFIQILKTLIKSKHRGTFNCVGRDCLSKLEFGEMIANKFNLNKKNINNTSMSDHNFIAKRPQNMSLTISKLEECNICIPSISEGINSLSEDRIALT